MNTKSKFKLLFKSIFTQFGSLVSEEGQQIIWNEDGELAPGYEVYYESENQETGDLEYISVPDGEYLFEGKTIVVESGVVTEIREPEPVEAPAEFEEVGEVTVEPASVPEVREDPVFNPEDAYKELRTIVNDIKAEVNYLKEQVASLLAAPVEEDAFSAAKKTDETPAVSFFKVRK